MIGKTSFFLVGAIATVLLVSGMITEEASAFEPTEKEEKIIKNYVNTSIQLEAFCSGEVVNVPLCTKLEERQTKYLVRMNDLGIFTTDQEPDLSHLTEEYNSTRAAAKAGIEPIEHQPPTPIARDAACDCDDDEDPKTMYVKSAYKVPWSFLGYPLWSHYSGVPSADIDTGSTTATFIPIWNGYEDGLVPYCYTGSIVMPTTANYGIAMYMMDYVGITLVNTASTGESSYYYFLDPSDRKEYATQNNVVSGPTIYCTINSVSLS